MVENKKEEIYFFSFHTKKIPWWQDEELGDHIWKNWFTHTDYRQSSFSTRGGAISIYLRTH